MNNEPGPAAIQPGREQPSTPAWSECVTPTAGGRPGAHTEEADDPPDVSLLRRLKVVTIGIASGALFAFYVAAAQMPDSMSWSSRAAIWAAVMAGPFGGPGLVHLPSAPSLCLGWLATLLIPAHPLRPNTASAWVTALGLAAWFFAGYLAVILAVWGA